MIPGLKNDLLATALAYVRDFDWYVFPVGRDKKPQTPHGFKDAAQDAQQIRQWWSRWPSANIGIACGTSQIIVVDLDVKHGIDGSAAWEKLCEGHEPTATATASTPSGGRRLYFSAPDMCEIGNSAGKLAPGIDVRGIGG